MLRDGESNPGLPRDRRGYSPLLYTIVELLHDLSFVSLNKLPERLRFFYRISHVENREAWDDQTKWVVLFWHALK